MGFGIWYIMAQKVSVKRNFIFNAIYQLSGIIIPLITLPYLSRILHAEGLGKYSYNYSIAFYFYMFIKLGLQNYGNRTVAYVKDDKEKLSRAFCEIYGFQIFMGIIITFIYVIYVMTIASNKGIACIFIIMVFTGCIDLTWALYGLEEFKVTTVRDLITKIFTTLAIFIVVKNAEDTWKYALIYCIGFFFSNLVALPVVFKRIKYIRPTLDGIKKHIKPNLVLFLPTIAVSIYKTMDKIMLGSLASEIEVGYYHSCEKIINVPLALITALGTVMLPRMSNIISKNEKAQEAELIFEKSIIFAMFISTSICVGIMTVSDIFVPLFYGDGFEKCIILFNVVLPSCIFLAFANVIRTQYLLPRKKDKLFVASLFSGAAVNLVLNVLLIPKYASVGAAIGTLVAEMVVCVVQSISVFKEANIGRNIINSIPFILSGIAMYVAFYGYIPTFSNQLMALFVKILISGVFYLAVLGILLFIKNLIRRKTNG